MVAGLVMLMATMPAQAKTPDGETPSMESVCDLYSGAAYGICNAYCEAMDCHLDEPRASARACERKRERFVQLTNEAPPCELSCPCQAIDGFDAFIAGEVEANMCLARDPQNIRIEQRVSVEELSAAFVSTSPVGDLVCGYFDSFAGVSSVEVEAEEFEFCADLLLAVAEDADLTCDPGPPGPG